MKGTKGKSKDELKRLHAAKEKAQKGKAGWVKVYEHEKAGWETALERIDVLTREIEALEAQMQEWESAQRISGEITISDDFLHGLLDRFEEIMSSAVSTSAEQ